MNLKKEILKAKGYNWAKLIKEKTDRICYERRNDINLSLDILNGNIFNQAQKEIAYELKNGILDKMLTPIS